MKAVTGNRLADGAVVYLTEHDQWTVRLGHAARFDKEDAPMVLDAAQLRKHEITDAYLIELSEEGALAGREALRETIRKLGPTVRPDLGLQAGV